MTTNPPSYIPLTHGAFAIVDAGDYAFLMEWDWYLKRSRRGKLYAARSVNNKLRKGIITMHGVLLPTPDGMEPDHINGDGLDNRRGNLRAATHQQNMWNRGSQIGSSSKYKGVSLFRPRGYYKATIMKDGLIRHLGYFWDEEEAAITYNRAAKELFGEFARLNQVEDRECLTKIPTNRKSTTAL